jgi:hypothetical protein
MLIATSFALAGGWSYPIAQQEEKAIGCVVPHAPAAPDSNTET